MKISIIIPTYNCGQYIKKAIDSVLNQSYKDKELIIIDNSSTDETLKILKSYGDKIKFISEKDRGQADAINKGFGITSGEIISWLNADDYYEPNIFEYIVDEFKKNEGIVLVYGDCNSIRNGRIIKNVPKKNISLKKMLNNGNYIFQPSSFYKSKAVKDIGGLNEKLFFWMEYELFIKLFKIGSFQYINKTLSNFTIREDQKTNKKNLKYMNNEVYNISVKNGGNKFSKLFFKRIFYNVISIN